MSQSKYEFVRAFAEEALAARHERENERATGQELLGWIRANKTTDEVQTVEKS